MTDNVIRYDPDTDEVIFPNGRGYPYDPHRCALVTAKALHEAEQKIERLEAARGKRPWCGSYAHLTDPPADLPPGVAPHPSLPEGEYLALGEDVRNLPADEWQRRYVDPSLPRTWLASDDHNEAAPARWYIVRRIPAPATKRVPWWECIDRVFAGAGRPIIDSIRVTAEDVRLFDLQGAYIADPDLDGTVEVLA